uniref:PGG domain-containing protein n=1 Tax=Cannabis sativa TaxID=3483 RepID=A0A803P3I9_CANSA
MFEAIENNEEEEVTRLIGVNRNIVRARHPLLGETALHHAVSIGYIGIVRTLGNSMDREDLEIKDRLDMNALGLAARTGNIAIAMYLVERNNNLVNLCNDRRLPVELALQNAQKEMGRYLYVATPMLNFVGDNREHGASVITLCIVHSLPEIALHLLHHHPELTIAQTVHTKETPIYRFSTDISDALCNLSSSDRQIYNGITGVENILLQNIEREKNVEAATYLLRSINVLRELPFVQNLPPENLLRPNIEVAHNHVVKLRNAFNVNINVENAQNLAQNLAQYLRAVVIHRPPNVDQAAQNLARKLEATAKVAQNLAQNLLAANLAYTLQEQNHRQDENHLPNAQEDQPNLYNLHQAQIRHAHKVKDAHNLAENIEATGNLAQGLVNLYSHTLAKNRQNLNNQLGDLNRLQIDMQNAQNLQQYITNDRNLLIQNLTQDMANNQNLPQRKLQAQTLAQNITNAWRFAQNFAQNLQANNLNHNIEASQTIVNNLTNARTRLQNLQAQDLEATRSVAQSVAQSLAQNIEDAQRLHRDVNDALNYATNLRARYLADAGFLVQMIQDAQHIEPDTVECSSVLVTSLQVHNLIQNLQAQNFSRKVNAVQNLDRQLRETQASQNAAEGIELCKNLTQDLVHTLQAADEFVPQNPEVVEELAVPQNPEPVVPQNRRNAERRLEPKLNHHRTLAILNCMYKHIVGLQEKRMKMANVDKALQEAARRGLLDVFETINNANPSILRLPIAFGVFNVAVRYRHRNIFSLLQRIPSRNAITNTLSMTKTGEMYSIVQHAALLAPANHLSKIPGPALQMKSELEWFEEVKQKSTVYPRDILEAEELFTKEHKELKSAGEKWMKDTATACSLVGSLIITIMFAVALTVPGGSLDKDEGLIRAGSPILLNDKWFTIFVTFDVISLLSATCSVLIFLAILTSRYGEKDFLTSLPTKLMTGLIFLFLSIATMTLPL